MPIVVRPAESSTLSQGDILRDVPFAVTTESGTLASDKKAKYVLVVSRPCQGVREATLTVAPVLAWPLDLKKLAGTKSDGASLDRMRRLLAGVRDGGQLTDTFYLGPLEDSSSRFAANLATLSTILVPTDPAARQTWIKSHRVWRLHEEFVQDLHIRLFNTFSRMGFDDHSWFADIDLDVLIKEGDAEVLDLKKSINDIERTIQGKEALSQPTKAMDPLKAELAKKKIDLQELEERLRPYIEEKERRKSPQ